MKFIKQYINYLTEMSLTKDSLETSGLYLASVKQKKTLHKIELVKTKEITKESNEKFRYTIKDTTSYIISEDKQDFIKLSDKGLFDYDIQTIAKILK